MTIFFVSYGWDNILTHSFCNSVWFQAVRSWHTRWMESYTVRLSVKSRIVPSHASKAMALAGLFCQLIAVVHRPTTSGHMKRMWAQESTSPSVQVGQSFHLFLLNILDRYCQGNTGTNQLISLYYTCRPEHQIDKKYNKLSFGYSVKIHTTINNFHFIIPDGKFVSAFTSNWQKLQYILFYHKQCKTHYKTIYMHSI